MTYHYSESPFSNKRQLSELAPSSGYFHCVVYPRVLPLSNKFEAAVEATVGIDG